MRHGDQSPKGWLERNTQQGGNSVLYSASGEIGNARVIHISAQTHFRASAS
jgi:hypothetical protein